MKNVCKLAQHGISCVGRDPQYCLLQENVEHIYRTQIKLDWKKCYEDKEKNRFIQNDKSWK